MPGEYLLGEDYSDGRKKRRFEAMGKLRAIDFTYHEKNLYAINNVRAAVLCD